MKPHDEPHGACFMDPISAIGSALFGLIPGMMMGGSQAQSAAPVAAAAPTPPPSPAEAAPAQQQPAAPPGSAGQKPGSGANSPSFVGSAAVPAQQGYGQKSLLGQ